MDMILKVLATICNNLAIMIYEPYDHDHVSAV